MTETHTCRAVSALSLEAGDGGERRLCRIPHARTMILSG